MSMQKFPKKYGITKIFYSIQGEGSHTGMPSIFIRFAGCNDDCSFCDTDYSLKQRMTAQEIEDECLKYSDCSNVIFTGGEPLLQLDMALINQLSALGLTLNVETNGSINITDEMANALWVTCSPKFIPIQIDTKHIDELKLLYNENGLYLPHHFCEYQGLKFLQPLYGENEKQTIQFVLDNPDWNLSIQTHKLIGVE